MNRRRVLTNYLPAQFGDHNVVVEQELWQEDREFADDEQ